jgi:hypothetical protein
MTKPASAPFAGSAYQDAEGSRRDALDRYSVPASFANQPVSARVYRIASLLLQRPDHLRTPMYHRPLPLIGRAASIAYQESVRLNTRFEAN